MQMNQDHRWLHHCMSVTNWKQYAMQYIYMPSSSVSERSKYFKSKTFKCPIVIYGTYHGNVPFIPFVSPRIIITDPRDIMVSAILSLPLFPSIFLTSTSFSYTLSYSLSVICSVWKANYFVVFVNIIILLFWNGSLISAICWN